MKYHHRIPILVLALALIFQSVFVFDANAAAKYTYYQTSKKDVPIWSDASSKSTKKKTIAKKGTVLIVASSKTNSSGNLWYKLKDGTWVFSGNVTSHSHSYDSNSGGFCISTGCDYEYPITVKPYKESLKYIVTNKDGATIWSRPYSGKSTKIRLEKKGSALMVKAEASNERKNLWYQLEDGNWVYSGNVQPKNAPPDANHPHTFDSNSGGYCTVKGCNYEFPITITPYKAVKYFVVTNNDGATIWSRPYSGHSDKIRLEETNSIIKVKAETTNERKNLWYQLEDGNWVFSGNVQPDPNHLQELIDATMSFEDYVEQQYRYPGGSENGICDTCCMVNMLNRRLVLDGKYETEKFSIERTICIVNNYNTSTYKVDKEPDKDHTGRYDYIFPEKKENFDKTYTTTGGKEYTVTIIGKRKKHPEREPIPGDVSAKLIELLDEHPEGVIVHQPEGKAYHGILVISYEIKDNKTSFKCIDPAKMTSGSWKINVDKATKGKESKFKYDYLNAANLDYIMYINN